MLKQIWSYLIESVKVPPEFEEVEISQGRLSPEQVRTIALKVREEEQWWMLEPRDITLYRKSEDKRLVWIVDFPLEAVREQYFTGTRGAIEIDDETGEVISKSYVPR